MLISEMIEQLKEYLRLHGDLPVFGVSKPIAGMEISSFRSLSNNVIFKTLVLYREEPPAPLPPMVECEICGGMSRETTEQVLDSKRPMRRSKLCPECMTQWKVRFDEMNRKGRELEAQMREKIVNELKAARRPQAGATR